MISVSIPSPIGGLTIAEDDDAIVAIRWADAEGEPSSGNGSALLAEAARQLDAYFAGHLTRFDLPLAPAGSPFETRVWTAMAEIPYGETRGYGELATTIGSAPRAIGRACGRNPIPIVIPCHRVLAKTGLGGYSGSGGLATKRHLLALERACQS
jgi:methylated-DNA-[protein]-cysteine S-methyltransferase